jgi:DNA-binding MarR family transcriptional regulator/ribosomal protein S18 acetylase RimI-like enzyme
VASAATTLAYRDDPVQAVRRFNRFYTRQIGVLQEHLLRSRFSLTEVRVLYELAHRDRLTAVELRRELGLDRGYLSRMLRNFEQRRWIKTQPSHADQRRIFLSLTKSGQRVFASLDRRSSKEVATLLARLRAPEQSQLIGAMREIESVLGRSEQQTSHPFDRARKHVTKNASVDTTGRLSAETPTYILRAHQPGDMGWVVQRHGELYWKEYGYDERFEALVAEIVGEFIRNFDARHERCWIAEKEGARLGTIFLVKKSESAAKLRLLLVEPDARGLGIGKRLVSECVNFACAAGYKKILLWTQSELHAARHLYERAGFRRIKQEPHQSWGRNDLVAETWELALRNKSSQLTGSSSQGGFAAPKSADKRTSSAPS